MADAPLTLYLDLAEGEKPDLEVVARASLAWAAAVKEIAFHLDPGLEVSVELASGTPGSLNLNTLVRSVRDKIGGTNLRIAIISAIVFVAKDTASWGVGEVLDWIKGPDGPAEVQELSDEEIDEIATKVVEKLQGAVAQKEVRQVYKELERDQSITGAGATLVPDKKPERVIPRASFPTDDGPEVVQEVETKRTDTIDMQLVVQRAILVEDKTRKWEFGSDRGKFGALVRDQDFLESVWEGTARIPMMAGVVLDAEVEVTEELRGNVWETTGYVVTQVRNVSAPPRQRPLAAPTPENEGAADDDDSGDDER